MFDVVDAVDGDLVSIGDDKSREDCIGVAGSGFGIFVGGTSVPFITTII